MTLAAIHQPTFLPWLGWWDKLARCDVFVLLDDVQFPKKGGSWINRVRLLVAGKAGWVTVPVDRSLHGARAVREILVDDTQPWRRKLETTLATSYGRARFYDEVLPTVAACLREPTPTIAELNEAAIRQLGGRLGLDTGKLVRQSDLRVNGLGTDLLVALTRAAGGDAYLTGDGADEYLDEEQFARAGLGLIRQRFTAPRYPQPVAEHVTGLSVVDALMNCGWEGTAALITR
jgi:WbqC-like protein